MINPFVLVVQPQKKSSYSCVQQFLKKELDFKDEACTIEELSKRCSRIHITKDGNLEIKYKDIYECLKVVKKHQKTGAKLISPKNIMIENIQIKTVLTKADV